jgi:hypothetical protein
MKLADGKVEAVFSSIPSFSAELVAGQQSLQKDRFNPACRPAGRLQPRNHVLS